MADGERGAVLSPDGLYRYRLWRRWDSATGPLVFVMLNPSTADGLVDDPTIRRCVGFARTHGYGGIDVVNLFAYRATNPRTLDIADDPVGPDNDQAILAATLNARTVLAWGALRKPHQRRALHVLDLLARSRGRCYALGLTASGAPRHPLYLRGDAPLIPYGPGCSVCGEAVQPGTRHERIGSASCAVERAERP